MAKGKYQEWLTDDGLLILKGYARDGLTDLEIAKKIGISKQTFYNWISKYIDFSDTIKEGRKPVATIIEDAFFDTKLKGYFVDEEVTEKTVHKDAKGNVTGMTEHKRINKRYIPPDTTAMIFTLKCRLPSRYSEKRTLEIETKHEGKLADLIEGLKENDIYTETTASDEAVADEPTKTN